MNPPVADPLAASLHERLPLLARDALTGALPEPWRWWANSLVAILALIVVFTALFAFLTLAERKVLARVQNRPGPNRAGIPLTRFRLAGLGQPLADGIKMLTKEDIVPRGADPVLHFLAPVLLLALSLLTFAVLPYGRLLVPVELEAGVLYFFAAGAATELALFIAGWASRNKYSLLAAMRALAQLISYELPLLLAVIPVVLLAGSLSTSGIVAAQAGWDLGFVPRWFVLTPWGFASFLIFLTAALAESESELIAGHLTEYSGFKYALFFMAEYLGMTALTGLGVTLFLGGWRAPLPFLEFVPSYAWFGLKLLALLFVFMWIRATFPRLRIDQLTRLAWKFLVPLALLNLGTAALWALTAGWGAALQPLRWLGAAALVVGPFVLLGRGLTAGLGPRTYRFA